MNGHFWPKRKLAFFGLTAFCLLAAWLPVAPFLADNLVVEKRLESADAIIILSGAADYRHRARGGADAYRAAIAPRVFITDDGQRGGWDDTEKGNPFFVERMERDLAAQGVPPDAVERLPGQVSGTSDEAELAVRIANERGYKSLLVVTSEFHARRALWAFERFARRGSNDLQIGILLAPSGQDYPKRYTWWLTPRGWRTVGAEYVKFCWYWLFY